MLTKNKEIPTEVINEGFIAAGKTLAFPVQETTTIVSLPPHLASKADSGQIRTLTVSGDSLKDIGIFDGDKVICKKAFNHKEIEPPAICVVLIRATGECVAKRVRQTEGMLRLMACNKEVKDMFVRPEDVEITGVVVGICRGADEFGRFDRGYNDFDDVPL